MQLSTLFILACPLTNIPVPFSYQHTTELMVRMGLSRPWRCQKKSLSHPPAQTPSSLHRAVMGQATSMGLYTYVYLISWKIQALRRQLHNCPTGGTCILDDYLVNLKSGGDKIFNLRSLTFGSEISTCLMTESPKVCIWRCIHIFLVLRNVRI